MQIHVMSALAVGGLVAVYVVTAMRQPIGVIDGDSITLAAYHNVRVDGLDTPEKKATKGKKTCAAEKVLAKAATEHVRELLASRDVRIEWASWKLDKWGRPLVRVTVGGRDLVDILVERGLAYHYDGGTKKSFCPS